MNNDFFMWNLDINDTLTSNITSQVIAIALIIAGVCFIINVAHNYLTTGFNKLIGGGNDTFPNYSEIARCIVIIICISSYLPIASVIIGTVEMVNKASSSDRFENLQALQSLQNANTIITPDDIDPEGTLEDQGKIYTVSPAEAADFAKKHGESSVQTGLLKEIQNLLALLTPRHLAATMIHSLSWLLLQIIKIVIMGITVMLTKILVIVGPLAFAFSILPCFSKQLETWFGTLLGTAMTLTTLNILDIIFDGVTGYIFGNMSGNAWETMEAAPEIIAFDLVFIVVYCCCFWLTSKYVGKGDAGRIISKMVGIATTIAAIAVSGGAAAAAKGGAIQGAANIGKNAIED